MKYGMLLKVIGISLVLSGCSTDRGVFARKTLQELGRAESAAALENSIWWICRASPIGSIRDRYGRSEIAWNSWRNMCGESAQMEEIPNIK